MSWLFTAKSNVRKKKEAMAHLENIIFILLLVHVLNSTTPFFFNFYVIPPEHSQAKKKCVSANPTNPNV